jgi:hypothetical protein
MATTPSRSHRWASVLAIAVALLLVPARSAPPQSVPARVSDAEFWKMVVDFSEPGGFFRSDNFVSNETTFQYIIPDLIKSRPPGGVYIGVGPDQNFSYIVALRPRLAFVVDIRRQNMIEHLMYRAVMELAPNRADFIARLFSRPRPAGLIDSISPATLFRAYEATLPDTVLYRKNLAAIKTLLVERHHFGLTTDDLASIDYVYEAFFAAGPDLTYSFSVGRPGRGNYFGRRMPSYAELMMETDGTGVSRSYLATEDNYRTLRELEMNNLVVPLVGDFAGEKAIRAVGKYLKDHHATVTAFYTSNVEQYLFQQGDDWRRFFANVATLPVDGRSTFIRAVFNYMGFRDPASMTPGPRSTTMLCPIADLLKAFEENRIQTYYDVIQMSTAPTPAPD